MKKYFVLLFCIIAMWSCTDVHFIQDQSYREKVEKRFKERKKFAENRSTQLFGVFNKELSTEEKEALQFLYAYMPLCDLADYNGDFFLKQVQTAFEARDHFEWGQQIPNEIFRHFVLPYRVNNENLDSARWVFLKELKPRLKGLGMKEAALEVNHWCHEKVNYAPTDIRTSGPLSLVRTSWGRCGEESTFTVTALRAVGIPARQVYTPRWAHSDDNHAWVEVWTDGKWSYLGACEPEADLNMGWFTEPARRAMLVHTKVFGDYQGEDEVVNQSDNYTEINVIENYADAKKVFVKVVDAKSNSIQDVRVDFGLYNYAEFYPIASKKTDENGLTYLTTGYGDILVWADKGGKYTCRKLNVSLTDTIQLVLGDGFYKRAITDENFIPPVEKKPYHVDESKKKENNKRLAQEDSIRFAYRTTFIDSIKSYKISEQYQLDSKNLWTCFQKSQGNWITVENFIRLSNSVYKGDLLQLLNLISDKDLRDTDAEILLDHFQNTFKNSHPDSFDKPDYFWQYVLNPRIKNEMLIAYRGYLQTMFEGKLTGDRDSKVEQIKQWILNEIQINENENYYNLPISPKGVYELRIANAESRDIFFVALCRSFGIPSRLESAEKTPQYFNGEKWINIYFKEKKKEQPILGSLQLINQSNNFDPNYYIHFTIGKLTNGRYESLDFGWNKKLSELPKQLQLEVGNYRLVTGRRGLDGSVYAHFNHFEIKANNTQTIELKFRDPKTDKKVFGKLNSQSKVKNSLNEMIPISTLKKNNSIVLMWLEPGKEPTRHLMEEFKEYQQQYENWNGHIAVLKAEEIQVESLSGAFFENMPQNFAVYQDENNSLLKHAKKELGITGKVQKPLILILNSDSEIILTSSGYKIGIHDHILKTLGE